eukprot:3594507-Prymnesium_polylepis.1
MQRFGGNIRLRGSAPLHTRANGRAGANDSVQRHSRAATDAHVSARSPRRGGSILLGAHVLR